MRSFFTLSPAERQPVALLLGLAFCLGLARNLVQTAGGTLLMVDYGPASLPYNYLATSLVVPAIGLAYDALSRRLALLPLTLVTVGGLFAGTAGLWAAVAFAGAAWPSFVAAVWYEAVWAMTALAVWSIAGRIFNLRQGKRLYGLIGAGDVLAAILGGLLTPAWVTAFGLEGLLLLAAASLAAACGLLVAAWRPLTAAVQAAEADDAASPKLPHRADTRSYIAFLLALVALSFASFYFIDNLFYTVVDAVYPAEAELASFLGLFWALVNALTLASNVFLVNGLLSRFGVRAGLMLLPLLSLAAAGVMAVALAQPQWAAAVFGLAVLNNLFDWVLRETVHKSTLLVLYQPLPAAVRLRVQTLAESVAQPLAQGAAGLGLLALQALAIDVAGVNAVLIGMLASCVGLAVLVSRRYLPVLTAALDQRRFQTSQFAPADEASLSALQRAVGSPYPGAVSYALEVLADLNHPSLITGVYRALQCPVAEVRLEGLRRVERFGLRPLAGAVQERAQTDPAAAVRGAALRALPLILDPAPAAQMLHPHLTAAEAEVRQGAIIGLLRLGDLAPTLAAGQALSALLAGPRADRLTAAAILGEAGIDRYLQPMLTLLNDPEIPVQQAALTAARQLRHPALWPAVARGLHSHHTRAAAIQTLTAVGEAALPALERELNASRARQPLVAVRILRAIGAVPGEGAARVLKAHLSDGDPGLRQQARASLKQRAYRVPPAERPTFETAVWVELEETAYLLAALVDVEGLARQSAPENAFHLVSALRAEVDQAQQRVLGLLALLHPPTLVAQVQTGLAGAADQRAIALEVVEGLVSPRMRPMLTAALEAAPPAEVLARLAAHFPQPRLALPARLAEIALDASRRYSAWVRVCALYTLAVRPRGNRAIPAQVLATPTEPLVREMAVWALGQIDPPARRGPAQTGGVAMLSLIEKVLILKSVTIFAETPPAVLAEVANLLEEVDLQPGERLFTKGEPGESLYIVVDGQVRVHDGEVTVNHLGPRTIVGEMAVLDAEPRLASVTAVTPTWLLRLNQEALYEVMADRVEIARGIIHVLSSRLRGMVAGLTEQHRPPPG